MPKLKIRPGGSLNEEREEAVEMPAAVATHVRDGKLMVKESLRLTLWQETLTPGVYRKSVVKTNNPVYYLNKVGPEGFRVFYTEVELDGLDPGWIAEDVMVAASLAYKCPVPGCRKQFPKRAANGVHGLRLLQGHVSGFHKRDYDSFYKDMLERRVKTEVVQDGEVDIPATS